MTVDVSQKQSNTILGRPDQRGARWRLYDEALHAQHQAAADWIDESRLQPGAVLLKKFFGERRKKFHHVKERPLLLDHRVNRDVLERDCSRHLGAFLGLSGAADVGGSASTRNCCAGDRQ
jgi:hypothetical protein